MVDSEDWDKILAALDDTATELKVLINDIRSQPQSPDGKN